MSTEIDRIHVHVKYKDAEQNLEGTAEETWTLLNRFFCKFIPSFEVASNLWLSADIKSLAKDCEGLIAFSPEGSNVLVPKTKLTDNESLSLWLLASYLGKQIGLLDNDSLSKEVLQAKINKSTKITSTRLGELVKNDWAVKTADDRFRMTTFGVTQMQKDVLPRIIVKTEL